MVVFVVVNQCHFAYVVADFW